MGLLLIEETHFIFHLPSLRLALWSAAAVKRLHDHHNSSDCISMWPFEIIRYILQVQDVGSLDSEIVTNIYFSWDQVLTPRYFKVNL